MSAAKANANTPDETSEEVVYEEGLESEEEVEEEVDEVEEVEEEEEEVAPVASGSKKPTSAKAKPAPGKVTPSPAVRKLQMITPEALGKKKPLNPTKNPFPSTGHWDAKTFSEIKVVFAALTSKNETTNELTRANHPEARYWKAPITFSYSSFSSTTIRFDNVQIPFHSGRDYGSKFVYVGLPPFAGTGFADAGKTLRPTVIQEKSLLPDPSKWWKIANSVDQVFGSLNNTTNKFYAKSLATIFESTGKGVTANIVAKFNVKASTDDRLPLKPATHCTVALEIVRGYIVSLDVDIPPPGRVMRTKAKVEPLATSSDVATDDLMKRLSELGL